MSGKCVIMLLSSQLVNLVSIDEILRDDVFCISHSVLYVLCSVFCILYYHNLFFVFIFISLFRFLSYSFCSDGDSRTKSVSRNHVNRPFLSRTIRLWHFHSCRPKVVKRIHVFYINYCNVYNQHIQMYQFPVDVYDKIKVLKTPHL